jgi:hypothetical protein
LFAASFAVRTFLVVPVVLNQVLFHPLQLRRLHRARRRRQWLPPLPRPRPQKIFIGTFRFCLVTVSSVVECRVWSTMLFLQHSRRPLPSMLRSIWCWTGLRPRRPPRKRNASFDVVPLPRRTPILSKMGNNNACSACSVLLIFTSMMSEWQNDAHEFTITVLVGTVIPYSWRTRSS